MKYYISLSLVIASFIAMVHCSQAQQSIDLMGVEYHRNIASNSADSDFYDFKAKATVPISFNDQYFFAALPQYSQTFVENLGFGLPSHVFKRINVPFIFEHKISKHRSIGGVLSPGIHSDFKDISGEDWVLIAAAFLRNTKNPKFKYRYGLVFSYQVNGMIIIPAIMFNWQPTDRISVDNKNPLAPEFSYAISPMLSTGLVLERHGGSTKLSKDYDSRYVKDIRYNMAPYIDVKIWDKFVMRGAVGYTFSRKVGLYEDIDAGSTWNENPFESRDALKEKKFSGWFFNLGLRLEINRNQ